MPSSIDTGLIASTSDLEVGGLVPLTTGDFPNCLSAVIFCQGCPWRCRYCHNPHLQPRTQGVTHWHEILSFLERRRGLLDAVVFSGGEPLVQPGLSRAINQCKALGFKVGLHTGGCLPATLEQILPLLDWVGLDIKAPDSDYASTTGVQGSGSAAWQSVEILARSSNDFEVRTTRHSQLLSDDSLLRIASELQRLGVNRFALQEFRATGCLDSQLNMQPSTATDPLLLAELQRLFVHFSYRGN